MSDMITLNNLLKTVTKSKQRVGRGEGSNRGKNSGKGHKGQTKRGHVRIGFEGGQKALIRRLPKFKGFKALDRKDLIVLSTSSLQNNFSDGEIVNLETLIQKKLANLHTRRVRIIKGREVTSKISIADSQNIYLTKGAKEVIK